MLRLALAQINTVVGVNVAAMGLMAAVAWQLGRDAIVDPLTALLAILAAVLLIFYRVNSAWLVIGGGAVGLAVSMLGPTV